MVKKNFWKKKRKKKNTGKKKPMVCAILLFRKKNIHTVDISGVVEISSKYFIFFVIELTWKIKLQNLVKINLPKTKANYLNPRKKLKCFSLK